MEILRIVILSYLIGVNIYGFTILRIQKREALERMEREKIADIKRECREKHNSRSNHEDRQSDEKNKERSEENEERRDDKNDRREQTENESRDASAESECISNAESGLKISDDIMSKDKSKKRVRDGHLLFAALLGGAASIYLGMFFMKYKLKNILFMLLMPTFIGIHVTIIYRFLWGIIFIAPIT